MPTIIEGIKFYTIKDTAKALHVTPQTVRSYIKQGRIRSQRIGKPILITENNLREFLNIKWSMKKKHKQIIVVLAVWSLLHLVLFAISKGRGSTSYFYPFEGFDNYQIRYNYDLSEFLVYVLGAWLFFAIKWFLETDK